MEYFTRIIHENYKRKL